MKIKILLLIGSSVLLLAGCMAKSPSYGGTQVMVSPDKPPAGCEFLGAVSGEQGNFITGPWTPNRNLEDGAMNDLKNNAAQRGANYVQLINQNSTSTNKLRRSQMTSYISGNAYKCPPSSIAKS